ncbi:hypothetical protein IIA79_01800 [bacterium]|nr:hypothetical protein [bacterium]
MIVARWLLGFVKALFRIWDQSEWFYYAKTGIDPSLPAFQRWEVKVKEEDKPPESEAEDLLPLTNRWVILHDLFMQMPEEVLLYTTDPDKVDALVQQYERELRSRTSGDFYYTMVKGRQLDFFHDFKVLGQEPLVEGTAIDEEQEREKFLR